jgi:NADH-ubiquinone oxidoreductase chain 5
MYLLILFFPFFGFLCSVLVGRFLSYGVGILCTICIFLSFILSLFSFYEIGFSSGVVIIEVGQWIHSDTLNVNWGFCFDSLTCTMLVVVTFISVLVHLYSIEYMEQDPHLPRFMSYLSLFTFFMLILITANNFLQMFVGWEGVGLSSYLLINFWFTRIQANKSAIKAMLVNRVGDFFLLLAIFTTIFLFNSLDYDIVFSLVPLTLDYRIVVGGFQFPIIDFICLCIFFGAMGKSAQLGLHTWLPDAMEGPTPVSALIHAATMVTAGVFLITRCSYLFEFSIFSLQLISIVGSLTAFFAATTGLFQNDIKKVIAYSTCSQLGYMMFACGLSSYEVGMFHLSNHAFFKALLFLGSGSVIHAVSDEQDMRKLGGLKNVLPFSYAIMLIGSLALIGFPFLSGFYSKDIILEISFAKYTLQGHFSYALGCMAAFATAFYSTRVLFLVFLSNPNGNKNVLVNVHEGTWKMTLPLFVLCFMSIFIGFLSKDLFIGFGTSYWGSSIFVLPYNYVLSDIEFISVYFKLLPLFVTICGVLASYWLYRFGLNNFLDLKKNKNFKFLYTFFNKKWYFDRFYNQFFSQNILSFSLDYSYKSLDRGILEFLGPYGLVSNIKFYGLKIQTLQTGFILDYLFYIVFSITVILFVSVKYFWLVVLSAFFYLIFNK